MSYKQNIVVSNGPVQLVDKSRFGNSVSQGGVTCTNNGDGSWTINGNVTAENRFNLNFYQLGANVIPYWLSYMVPVEHNYYTQDCGYDKLGGWLFYYLEEGKNYENFKIYPQIISLTDTFGSGNEPKNKEQVKAKLPENLYPYNPTNRVTIYKELIKVSDVYQLLDKSKYPATTTVNGVTYTNNGDGIVTVSGTTTGRSAYILIEHVGVVGHKYLVCGSPVGGSFNTYRLTANIHKDGIYVNGFSDAGDGNISKVLEADEEISIVVDIADVSDANLIFKPQLFDLTEMFGSGNEPKTVAEFKAKFPDELYPYSPNCWITSYKNVSKVGDVCQLLDKSKYEQTKTVNGITFTNNGDGTITVDGTIADVSGSNASFSLNAVGSYIPVDNTHKYLGLTMGDIPSGAYIYVAGWKDNSPYHWVNDAGFIGSNGFFYQNTNLNVKYISISVGVYSDSTASYNFNAQPQWFDLTEMYGEGKEPKTVEEFRAKFPNEMYDYNLCCTV